MNDSAVTNHTVRPGYIDRLFALFSEIRPGEGRRALLMLLNVFLILISYCVTSAC